MLEPQAFGGSFLAPPAHRGGIRPAPAPVQGARALDLYAHGYRVHSLG
jgi:hypothetical protein